MNGMPLVPPGAPGIARGGACFAGAKKGGTTEPLRPLGRSGFAVLEGEDPVSFWEKVMGRLSVPGLLLVTAGAVLVFQAEKLCRLLFKDNGEKAVLPVRILGLALAVFGTVILLDWIPGL